MPWKVSAMEKIVYNYTLLLIYTRKCKYIFIVTYTHINIYMYVHLELHILMEKETSKQKRLLVGRVKEQRDGDRNRLLNMPYLAFDFGTK